MVIARDPSGRELGRTTTDNEGKFTFPAREHVDYCLTAETPDGHSATYTVHAAELPDNLPGSASTTAQRCGKLFRKQRIIAACRPRRRARRMSRVGGQLSELRKQIQELRRQIYESDQRLRFRDFLGGIGFILGLAGVAFYMKARGKRT